MKHLVFLLFLVLGLNAPAQLISLLPAGSAISDGDIFPDVQGTTIGSSGGSTTAVTGTQLRAYLDVWSKITGTPTTAAGYGIANGANIDLWGEKTVYAGSLTITTGKTFNVANSMTLSGTDGATLNIGAGGALGSAAFDAASAFDAYGAAAAAQSAAESYASNASNLSSGTVPFARLPTGITGSAVVPASAISNDPGLNSGSTSTIPTCNAVDNFVYGRISAISLPPAPTAFYAPQGDTFNAVAGQIIFVDPNAAPSDFASGTVILPSSPSNGDVVMIKDAGASDGSSGFSIFPLTVDGNGNSINGSSTITLSTDNTFEFFIWDVYLNQWFNGSM